MNVIAVAKVDRVAREIVSLRAVAVVVLVEASELHGTDASPAAVATIGLRLRGIVDARPRGDRGATSIRRVVAVLRGVRVRVLVDGVAVVVLGVVVGGDASCGLDVEPCGAVTSTTAARSSRAAIAQ